MKFNMGPRPGSWRYHLVTIIYILVGLGVAIIAGIGIADTFL